MQNLLEPSVVSGDMVGGWALYQYQLVLQNTELTRIIKKSQTIKRWLCFYNNLINYLKYLIYTYYETIILKKFLISQLGGKMRSRNQNKKIF